MGLFRKIKYRRYRKKQGSCLGSLFTIAFYCVLAMLTVYILANFWPIFLGGLGIVFACYLIYLILSKIFSALKNKPTGELNDDTSIVPTSNYYVLKSSLMTECEKKYFTAFCNILQEHYIVQPQINLASVINKISAHKYQNELFRNIDFGVFDNSYKLKLLIEINDSSHNFADRKERDKKIRTICEEANIPIIAFWTQYGINEDYIEKRLKKYLEIPTNYDETNTPTND